ncbi:MAG TPA: oxygen-dependent coproporphyrinogen oxidase [Casimicrobiaceae bacterium]|nr:oxygen-dependent coproporphyrinogen oxidase [Casimicrobiaceae bacterium]
MQLVSVAAWFGSLQDEIVAALQRVDATPFVRDEWQRPEGGGGITQVIENGEVFERAAVLYSSVTGASLPASATAHRPQLAGRPWHAVGVSLVIHPRNPYVPTVHFNGRFFVAPQPPGGAGGDVWWFGGGMDLTPYYGFVDDARHFHLACRDALAPFGAALHPRFKAACDAYFFLRHRNEARGIGGIFYDDFDEGGFERAFALTKSVGAHFVPAYLPIVERRRDHPFGRRERDFQAMRRGRYVEFNLVWDRGTLFGLQSGGRTEAILLSMPPQATWRYAWNPPAGSDEARLFTDFLPVRDWLA